MFWEGGRAPFGAIVQRQPFMPSEEYSFQEARQSRRKCTEYVTNGDSAADDEDAHSSARYAPTPDAGQAPQRPHAML